MKIEYLDEDLVDFINKYLPNLNWKGEDTSASADLLTDEWGTITDSLMRQISNAVAATGDKEFALTIRPNENKLIIYYFD